VSAGAREASGHGEKAAGGLAGEYCRLGEGLFQARPLAEEEG